MCSEKNFTRGCDFCKSVLWSHVHISDGKSAHICVNAGKADYKAEEALQCSGVTSKGDNKKDTQQQRRWRWGVLGYLGHVSVSLGSC